MFTCTNRLVITFLALITLILFLPSESFAALMRINSSRSLVRTTYTGNAWSLNQPTPDDAVIFAPEGTFELLLETNNGFNLHGGLLPDRIKFNNVNVSTAPYSGRTWDFPSFKGYIDGSLIYGTEDVCYDFMQMGIGGTCYSAGNFGTYSGTYSNNVLMLTGYKNPGWLVTGDVNGYYYTIVATVVPMSNSLTMLMIGLLFISYLYFSKRVNAKSF